MKLSSLGKSTSPPVDCHNRLAAKVYRPSVSTLREFYPYLKERQRLSLFSHDQRPVTISPDNRRQAPTIFASAIRDSFVFSDRGNGQNVCTGVD